MEIKNYTLPLSEKDIKSLKSGQIIKISGYVYTARDAAHKKLIEAINENRELPFEISGSAIYYCGPTPAVGNEIIGSCGPTTSGRMDDYTPALLNKGLKVMIGKGKRSRAVNDSIRKNSAVYLVAIGGAGALIKDCVKECSLTAYGELGCEAVYKLYIENLELLVGTDSKGNSILR